MAVQGLIFADIFRTSMTRKVMHTWFFPVLSLAVGLGHMLWFDFGFLPFMGLLMVPQIRIPFWPGAFLRCLRAFSDNPKGSNWTALAALYRFPAPCACICFSTSTYPFSRFDIQYTEDVFYPA
jgi:hypothetical protein